MTSLQTKFFTFISTALVGLAILLSFFTPINLTIFSAINAAFPSQVFWMTLTNTADGIFVGCLLLIALRKQKPLMTYALLCGLSLHYVIKFSKSAFSILRPEHAKLDYLFTLGPELALDNYAMPSGHAASATMAMIFILSAHKLNGWKFLLLISYPILAALSRIAVGAHWPADVCAGAAIGILLGLVFVALARRQETGPNSKAIQYITLSLYIPFIALAILQAASVHDLASLIYQGTMVLIGVFALITWTKIFVSLINKKALLAEH